jgi:hypothetical protein
MDLLGLNMPPAILLGADEVIEQDARARKLKLSRSQLGTWTKDSFGSGSDDLAGPERRQLFIESSRRSPFRTMVHVM